ncbi:HAMP domain-containing histidine kinase [Actinosynnema pretiosum subsp. pretiosum]|uniref:histidine kinase n=2 Tax=Actinosynnema TaxID=40566 RepID=C6WFW4_ACTMD|nr:HAMP domain-containing sensor histidine kinase [Actinosynnema mirum]ACU37900.1 histidine kinase [Actinosynnema mirum DSM 43827]AXX31390.1 periplasmic sensor signal transduction histidine kinase [Actinosynnema pretiosum subsp. pretiosum]QUF04557.1 HAMP domain-containing histidine kinase [Actinosynnema pretiosum subsp. pretiosum]
MPKLSLRRRVAVLLGSGSLLITSTLSFATWSLTSEYLLRQREQSATRQAEVNVKLVEAALVTGSAGLEELLTGLTTGPDSTVLVHRGDRVLASGRQVRPESVPGELVDLGKRGTPATQRLRVEGVPVLAVVLPLGAPDGVYVELAPLVQLDRTFRFLSALLVAGALAGGALGTALGFWASGKALRPLSELTRAASRVARGDLAARVPEQSDPDLDQLATSFNSTADALERRVLRDARFAGDVSHELRSPLTTMVNAAAVLRRRGAELDGTAGKALALLTSEVDRFARMVVDLLEISRSAEHELTDPDPIDVAELLRNVLTARRSTVPLDAVDEAVLVLGDHRMLDRVVSNLLDNAERHAGGAVRVGLLRRGDRARIEVDDAGAGVPEQLRERIFERFDRGARAGSRGGAGGSGLGLALVAQHVRRHGGVVRVEERPGGGARFAVEIPEAGA